MIVRKTQMLIFVTFDNKYMFQDTRFHPCTL